MIDQKTITKKNDFFELEVAKEEEIAPHAVHSAEYVVPTKDLAEYPSLAAEYAQKELRRRIDQGIESMREYISSHALSNCSPVICSRPDWENIGLVRYSIRIERSIDLVNTDGLHDIILQANPNITEFLAQCTPGRNAITGGE